MAQVLHITYSMPPIFQFSPKVPNLPKIFFSSLYAERGVSVSQSLVSLWIPDNCFYELAAEDTCFADGTSLKTISSLALWFIDHFSVSQPGRIRIFFFLCVFFPSSSQHFQSLYPTYLARTSCRVIFFF